MAYLCRLNVSLKACEFPLRLSCRLLISIRRGSNAHSYRKKLTREERYMKKLCEGLGSFRKRKDLHLHKLAFGLNDENRHRVAVSAGMVRRANQLSAVIHENIYYCFCYEDVCPDMLRYNFEISKVKMTPDLNNLNVYWNATGDKQVDDEIEQLLKASRGKLRSALTQKRIMSRIPPLQFIKDVKATNAKHIEDLLSRADMGTDHALSKSEKTLKSPPRMNLQTFKNNMSSPEVAMKQLHKKFLNDTYALKDGPGAQLVVPGAVDFGASSSNFSDVSQLSGDLGSVMADVSTDASELDEDFSVQLRNDIYDLDHGTLLMQVLHMKRRLKERGQLPETDTSRKKQLYHLRSQQLDSDNLDSRKIHKLLKDSLKKMKHKTFHLNDRAMREDWHREQMELIRKTFAQQSHDVDSDDSDDSLQEFDYEQEREEK